MCIIFLILKCCTQLYVTDPFEMSAQLMQHCLSAREWCVSFDTRPGFDTIHVQCGMASWCSLWVTYHQPWRWCCRKKPKPKYKSNIGTSAQLWHLLRENCSNMCLGFSSKNSLLLGPFLFSILFSGLQDIIRMFRNHRQRERASCFKHVADSELKLPQAVYPHNLPIIFRKKKKKNPSLQTGQTQPSSLRFPFFSLNSSPHSLCSFWPSSPLLWAGISLAVLDMGARLKESHPWGNCYLLHEYQHSSALRFPMHK